MKLSAFAAACVAALSLASAPPAAAAGYCDTCAGSPRDCKLCKVARNNGDATTQADCENSKGPCIWIESNATNPYIETTDEDCCRGCALVLPDPDVCTVDPVDEDGGGGGGTTCEEVVCDGGGKCNTDCCVKDGKSCVPKP